MFLITWCVELPIILRETLSASVLTKCSTTFYAHFPRGRGGGGHWPEHLPEWLHAYNVTPQGTTGCSPYLLLFGANPYLPIDALVGQEEAVNERHDWLVWHQERLREAHTKAREYFEKKAAKRVAAQKDKMYCSSLQVGQCRYKYRTSVQFRTFIEQTNRQI